MLGRFYSPASCTQRLATLEPFAYVIYPNITPIDNAFCDKEIHLYMPPPLKESCMAFAFIQLWDVEGCICGNSYLDMDPVH